MYVGQATTLLAVRPMYPKFCYGWPAVGRLVAVGHLDLLSGRRPQAFIGL